ncbi:iron-containing redox enzyme family protein [Rhodococcus sp. G-MC3]|uniref:iron-containing redox enzyme family protein n=1 Tax=Rhodococcus sp. G-MC3 TaxID=3046209 RepID=UPI0024BB0921|nr:iron-containing redox enzyme family protein [Rhodococcus sp. G-MC3]MDJ0392929.1 iron-containing redox enzyme family protein [Rhodococcus sp. G-MC3]
MSSSISVSAPPLPRSCGTLSEAVVRYLAGGSGSSLPTHVEAEPLSRDLQLALTVCYELHYRGFEGIDDDAEWDPDVLRFRRLLERVFLAYLRDNIEAGTDAFAEMDALSLEPVSGTGPSWYLRDQGTWEQMREYFAHRSLYHLKEADPHAWAIPRLQGQAKASFVAVEFDEYGGGRGERLHQRLWADLMQAAELDSTYLGYLDRVPAETLAWVNLMSQFGLHRSLRGATVGHFAATEITSSPGSKRFVDGLTRLGAPDICAAFYREHVEADAVHEQILRHDVVANLLRDEPHLEPDVVFGMRALDFVEDVLGSALVESWKSGRSLLL